MSNALKLATLLETSNADLIKRVKALEEA